MGKSKVDDDVLDALEEALLSSDMGVDTTLKVIENLEDRVEKDTYVSMDELVDLIRDDIPFQQHKPHGALYVHVRRLGPPAGDDASAGRRDEHPAVVEQLRCRRPPVADAPGRDVRAGQPGSPREQLHVQRA